MLLFGKVVNCTEKIIAILKEIFFPRDSYQLFFLFFKFKLRYTIILTFTFNFHKNSICHVCRPKLYFYRQNEYFPPLLLPILIHNLRNNAFDSPGHYSVWFKTLGQYISEERSRAQGTKVLSYKLHQGMMNSFLIKQWSWNFLHQKWIGCRKFQHVFFYAKFILSIKEIC